MESTLGKMVYWSDGVLEKATQLLKRTLVVYYPKRTRERQNEI
jgi:hypothetical protein